MFFHELFVVLPLWIFNLAKQQKALHFPQWQAVDSYK